MELIDPYINRSNYKKIIARYGGAYSLLERLKIGGIGSSKVIYKKGMLAFDEVKNYVGSDTTFVNFEILKSSIIIRVNKNQRLAVFIAKISEINEIRLEGLPVLKNNNTLYVGMLKFYFFDKTTLSFEVPIKEFKNIESFFSRSLFNSVFQLELLDIKPIMDNGNLPLEILD